MEPQFFAVFCQAIDRPDLIPGQVITSDLPKTKQEVREIIRSRTRDQWLEVFEGTDACLEPVLSLAEAFSDPQARERAMVVELPLPGGDTVKQLAHPIKYSGTPPEYRHSGVTPGTHTREVLEKLGYGDLEITELEKSGLFR